MNSECLSTENVPTFDTYDYKYAINHRISSATTIIPIPLCSAKIPVPGIHIWVNSKIAFSKTLPINLSISISWPPFFSPDWDRIYN